MSITKFAKYERNFVCGSFYLFPNDFLTFCYYTPAVAQTKNATKKFRSAAKLARISYVDSCWHRTTYEHFPITQKNPPAMGYLQKTIV